MQTKLLFFDGAIVNGAVASGKACEQMVNEWHLKHAEWHGLRRRTTAREEIRDCVFSVTAGESFLAITYDCDFKG